MNKEKLLESVKRHEGLRLKPYTDTVGKLTIGWGRNLSDVGITEPEAETLLNNDIEAAMLLLDVSMPWWKGIKEDAQLVLVEMCFNMGLGRLRGFKDFLDALEKENYQVARAEMLDSVWASRVGKRAFELADLMFKKEG